MPANSIRYDYAQWLAHPPTTGVFVETMQIYGPAVPPVWIANRVDVPLTAIDEMGIARVYTPLPFNLSRPAVRNSTEMTMTARIDGVDGLIYRAFAALKADHLSHPVYVNIRAYVDPNMLDRSIFGWPLQLRVESAKVAIPAIDLTLVGGRITNKNAGTFYTLQRFVGLRPF